MAETSYGADTWCLGELRPGRLARGRQLVAQALIRRIETPRGVLRGGEEESTYGFDVAALVGAVDPQVAARAAPSQVRAEWLKDDRVLDVSIEGVAAQNPDLTWTVYLNCVVQLTDESEPFPLSLAVTDVSVTLLGEIAP